MNYDNIFLAHYVCRKTALVHGSSGYGKSSTIYGFAERHGFQVLEKRTCYTDPIEVMLPVKNDSEKVVDFWPSRWLNDLRKDDCPPTVLFLDEFNRPASSQTFSMFTELLLDRSINGMKISDNVLILGACNLGDEDTGVMEIPDAVLKRVTNLAFAPTDGQIRTNMKHKIAKEALKLNPKILSNPAVAQFALNGNPRQIDMTCELFEAKRNGEYILTQEDVGTVARGRCGLEIGNILASTLLSIRKEEKFKLPRKCTPKNFKAISDCEQSGMALEVIQMLEDNITDCRGDSNAAKTAQKHIADYLLRYATPETCRAIKNTNMLEYCYPKDEHPVDADGKPFIDNRKGHEKFGQEITEKGYIWVLYALATGKLTARTQNN